MQRCSYGTGRALLHRCLRHDALCWPMRADAMSNPTPQLIGRAMLMCLLSTAAAAQDGLRSASLPERTPMNPIPPPRVDLFRAAPDTYVPRPPLRRDGHRRRDRHMVGASVFAPGDLLGYWSEPDRRTGIDSPELEPVTRSDPPAPPAAAPVAPPAMAPGPPKTFYVIPGCYAGDRPPHADRLPARCDVSKTRILPPTAGVVR